MEINFVFGFLVLLFIALIIGYILGIYFPIFNSRIKTDQEIDKKDKDKLINNYSEVWEIFKKSKQILIKIVSKMNQSFTLIYEQKTNKFSIEIEENLYTLEEVQENDELSDAIEKITDLQEQLGLKLGLVNKISNDRLNHDSIKLQEQPNETLESKKSIFDFKIPEKISTEDKSESIPAQIDEILQYQLKGTKLSKSGISMKERPGKGVVFIVGLDMYDEIDLVPDAEIQKAIRKAVETWEKLQADN